MLDYIDTHGRQIVTTGFGVMILWQLVTGVAWGGRNQRSVTRQDNPVAYTFRLAVETIALLAVLYYPKDEGRPAQSSQDVESDSSTGVAAAETNTPPVSPLQKRAFDLHRSGQYAPAVAVYDSLLAAADTSTELHYWRGIAHWRLAHTDLALADFRRVIALDDTNFNAPLYSDRILSAQRRWDDILPIWNAFIAKNPAHATAYLERGGTYFRKGDMTAAKADATKACELGNAGGCSMLNRFR